MIEGEHNTRAHSLIARNVPSTAKRVLSLLHRRHAESDYPIRVSERLAENLQTHHCPQSGDDTVSVPIAHKEAPSIL